MPSFYESEESHATGTLIGASDPGAISTFSLVAYLLTVLAWEVEVGVVLLHLFKKDKLDPLGHAALVVLWFSLTAFCWFRGKREFGNLCWTRGRIPVTAFQGIVVTIMMVAFGSIFEWIGTRLLEP
jgi:hypothetical protein